jgi:hypothetical protein
MMACLTVLTACSSPQPGTTTPDVSSTATAAFTGDHLSFRYPRQWLLYRYQVSSLFTTVIAYLSTSAVSDPCTTSSGGGAVQSISCGTPVSRLAPGSVLVTWIAEGMPDLTLASQPGEPASFGGLPARVASGRARDSCVAIGGTWQENVAIAEGPGVPADNLIEMDACATAPGIAQIRRQVAAMLGTVRYHS